ncbi:MAG TPA: SMC-Scp complex subunit ScpB [Tepidisphaeraceae bacterium]|nr:SMC-Scp complex subunit ScpB [Tepidisphaeraceae bacterium]
MRLVRDDDNLVVMEEQDVQPGDDGERALEASDDAYAGEAGQPGEAGGPGGLGGAGDTGDEPASFAEGAAPAPSAEEPDGAVDDALEDTASDQDAQSAGPAADEEALDLRALEALLFSTHHPLTAGRLAELLGLDSTKPLRRAIKSLNEQYAGRSFRVEQVAGGYQMLTLPEFGELLKALHQREVDAKLTKAALETLAIVAYKQPILRADVEAIRGVACGETIRSLMEKRLVKIAGRAEVPGRPILYGTTKRFLELFGLNTLKDLPQSDEGSLRPKPAAADTRSGDAGDAGGEA